MRRPRSSGDRCRSPSTWPSSRPRFTPAFGTGETGEGTAPRQSSLLTSLVAGLGQLLGQIAVDDLKVCGAGIGMRAQIAGAPIWRDPANSPFLVVGRAQRHNLRKVQGIAIGFGTVLRWPDEFPAFPEQRAGGACTTNVGDDRAVEVRLPGTMQIVSEEERKLIAGRIAAAGQAYEHPEALAIMVDGGVYGGDVFQQGFLERPNAREVLSAVEFDGAVLASLRDHVHLPRVFEHEGIG